jgi:hypothetical protein
VVNPKTDQRLPGFNKAFCYIPNLKLKKHKFIFYVSKNQSQNHNPCIRTTCCMPFPCTCFLLSCYSINGFGVVDWCFFVFSVSLNNFIDCKIIVFCIILLLRLFGWCVFQLCRKNSVC